MSARHRFERSVACAVVAALLGGCSTSAAIERRNGQVVYGHIDYADEQRLYVTDDDGRRVGLDRADIHAIDHPGKIGATAGGITSGVGFGVLMLAATSRGCSNSSSDQGPDCWDLQGAVLTIGVGILLVGLPILVRNLAVLSRSRTAAEPRAWAPAQSTPARMESW